METLIKKALEIRDFMGECPEKKTIVIVGTEEAAPKQTISWQTANGSKQVLTITNINEVDSAEFSISGIIANSKAFKYNGTHMLSPGGIFTTEALDFKGSTVAIDNISTAATQPSIRAKATM